MSCHASRIVSLSKTVDEAYHFIDEKMPTESEKKKNAWAVAAAYSITGLIYHEKGLSIRFYLCQEYLDKNKIKPDYFETNKIEQTNKKLETLHILLDPICFGDLPIDDALRVYQRHSTTKNDYEDVALLSPHLA